MPRNAIAALLRVTAFEDGDDQVVVAVVLAGEAVLEELAPDHRRKATGSRPHA